MLQFALPDYNHAPSETSEMPRFARVSDFVRLNFGSPVFGPRLGHLAGLAAMPVPEAAVHEYRHAMVRQHEVGCARQILSVEAESVSQPMQ